LKNIGKINLIDNFFSHVFFLEIALHNNRQKRAKRNWARQVDPGRRERACSRTRDEFGHFIQEKKLLQERDKMQVNLEGNYFLLFSWNSFFSSFVQR
jgi:hypothetical protein